MHYYSSYYEIVAHTTIHPYQLYKYDRATNPIWENARDRHTFMYVTAGEYIVFIENTQYIVQPGMLVLLLQDKRCNCIAATADATCYTVEFTAIRRERDDYFAYLGLDEEGFVSPIAMHARVDALFCELFDLFPSIADIGVQLHISADIMKLIAFYVEARSDTPSNPTDAFLPVLLYMREHCTDTVSVTALSTLLHMESKYFIRKFKKRFFASPIRWFEVMRMKMAANLLYETDLRIIDIAEQLHFDDASYFSRVFKRVFTISPCEYRRKFGKASPRPMSAQSAATHPPILFSPGNVVIDQKKPRDWIGDHIYESMDVLYIPEEGGFGVIIDRRHYFVQQGQVAFFPCSKRHIYKSKDAEPIVLTSVDFVLEMRGASLLAQCGFADDDFVIDISESEAFRAACTDATYMPGMVDMYARQIFRSAAMQIIAAIYIRMRKDFSRQSNCFDALMPAVSYMHEHVGAEISIGFLASLTGLTPTYFIQRFKKKFHETPKQYYNNLRAKRAATILADTDKPLEEICADLGFSDIYYFSSFFKKHFGINPKQYRRVFSE